MSDRPSDNLSLEDFPFRTFDKLRYGDTDRQGHVNNAIFSTFLETGRTDIFYDPTNPLAAEGHEFVIASLTLNFLGEIRWPGRVDIGTGIRRIGKSSATLYQGIFQDGRCVATANTVIVQMNEETRRGAPLSDGARAFLTGHLMAE